MRVSDNFQRANGSLGPNWSTPVFFAGGGSGAGGIQLLNNAFAPVTTAGSSSMSLWAGSGAGSFANDQYAQAKISVLAPFTSVVAITAAVFSAGSTTYTYTLTSGSALIVNQELYITGMTHAGNNGVFQVASLGAGTFTVVNASGFTATESGTGTSPSDSNCGLVVRGTPDGLNGYFLYIGTNSGLVASNGGLVDSRTQDLEVWKVVNGVANFMAFGGTLPIFVNDVFTLIASGTTLTVVQNGAVVFQTTDSSLTSGTPGIMTWSVGQPGEWATPTTWATGNSGTQMTNWIAGDDNFTFTQQATDTLKESTSFTQVAIDNFQRANGLLGANWVAETAPTASISSNKVQPTVANGAQIFQYWATNSFNNNQYSEITISALTDGSSFMAPGVRMSGAAVGGSGNTNGYIGLAIGPTGSASTAFITKFVNGTQTNITSVAATFQIGDVIRISAVGTTITMFQNGTQILQTTDAAVTSGFPGFFIASSTGVTNAQISLWAGGGVGIPTTFSSGLNQSWMTNSSTGASPNVVDALGPVAFLRQNVNAWPADQYSEVKLTGATAGSGPGARISSSVDTGYFYIFGGGNTAKFGKVVNGIIATLVSQPYTFNNGDVFRLETQGSTLVCKINGIINIVFIDSSIASGSAGVIGVSAAATASVSNWAAGSITGGTSITGTVVSCAPLPTPFTWEVIYTYPLGGALFGQALVVVGPNQAVQQWATPSSIIQIPTSPGTPNIVLLPCPPIVKWGTFGIGTFGGTHGFPSYFFT